MSYLKTITITDGRFTVPIAVRREWGFPKKVRIWTENGGIVIAPIIAKKIKNKSS